ncbi:MAG: hypothetical protein IJP89_02595 [Synergistaceae bacterium]|nr:hypothetical protein [Synergistaceae bacterium]
MTQSNTPSNIAKLRELLTEHSKALYRFAEEERSEGRSRNAVNLRAMAMQQEQALIEYLGEDTE